MAIVSHPLKLVYFDIPKVACTSLKTLLWELEHGRPLRNTAPRRAINRLLPREARIPTRIHDIDGYRTWSFARTDIAALPQDYDRITVLRDPIARLVSAWSNKASDAVFAARDEFEDLRNEGLSTQPSFSEFLADFERYKAVSRPVRVHNHPYAWHLGPDLAFYQHVFKIEDIGALDAYLSARAGRPMAIPRANRSSAARTAPVMTPTDIERIVALTQSEYDWLGTLYDRDAAIEKLKAQSARSA